MAANSEGFHNILAMTGGYPVAGNDGLAKPVFDIDSVGLISMLNQMNQGFDPKDAQGNRKKVQHDKTQFCIGAVRARCAKSRTARHICVGKFLARPRPRGETAKCLG